MVYIHLATGFEEIEAITVVDILRRAGVEIKMISMEPSLEVNGAHGITIKGDLLYSQADYENCQMIIFPGGMTGTLNLLNHQPLMGTLKGFAKAGKYIAAICAAPMIFGKTGLIVGKNATIFPGMEEELIGAKMANGNVVIDGNVVTSKGPGTAMEFAVALVAVLQENFDLNKLKGGLLFHER